MRCDQPTNWSPVAAIVKKPCYIDGRQGTTSLSALPQPANQSESRRCRIRLNTLLSLAVIAFLPVRAAQGTSKYSVLHSFDYGEQYQIGPPSGPLLLGA